MATDRELLNRYARRGSEEAFRALLAMCQTCFRRADPPQVIMEAVEKFREDEDADLAAIATHMIPRIHSMAATRRKIEARKKMERELRNMR